MMKEKKKQVERLCLALYPSPSNFLFSCALLQPTIHFLFTFMILPRKCATQQEKCVIDPTRTRKWYKGTYYYIVNIMFLYKK